MPSHQYVASLYATPPSGGVRFVFYAISTGFARVAHSTPWLFYAASPCGEAIEFGLPTGRLAGVSPPNYYFVPRNSSFALQNSPAELLLRPSEFVFRPLEGLMGFSRGGKQKHHATEAAWCSLKKEGIVLAESQGPHQRLLNWKRLRAPGRPAFLRSFMRESRVSRPCSRSCARYSSLIMTRERAIARLIAPV